ncbi:MAG: cupredoxin domain-containing protein [Candidatus Parcubacteria bacterium]|nr:cupredoxin domain-containing protein [Candidatus Parcubacteria bacterium]
MSPDKIIVIIIGFLAIVFIYWFFLMKKSKAVSVSADTVDIEVLGGYTPEVITIPREKTTKLNFFRKDPSSCLEEVVMGDFHIRKTLPLNEKVSIDITPQKAGEFIYSCGMGMFHGKIIVK